MEERPEATKKSNLEVLNDELGRLKKGSAVKPPRSEQEAALLRPAIFKAYQNRHLR